MFIRQLTTGAAAMRYWHCTEAGMAELADAADSKSAGLRPLGVQVPLPAPAHPLPPENRRLSPAVLCRAHLIFATTILPFSSGAEGAVRIHVLNVDAVVADAVVFPDQGGSA